MPRRETRSGHAAADGRLARRFAALRAERRAGLAAFLTAGDPDSETCLALMHAVVEAGAALLEIGLPAARPVMDGPVIQAAHARARAKGATAAAALDLVARFRARDGETPVVLMGYAETLRALGPFWLADGAARAGADAILIVDAEAGERAALAEQAAARGLSAIPILTSDADETVWRQRLAGARGFAYVVAGAGPTGGAAPDAWGLAQRLWRVRLVAGDFPMVVGFGVRTAEIFAAVAAHADAIAVGSALAERVAAHLGPHGEPLPGLVADVAAFARRLIALGHRAPE
jgi:tryptophan synthase alpha chain